MGVVRNAIAGGARNVQLPAAYQQRLATATPHLRQYQDHLRNFFNTEIDNTTIYNDAYFDDQAELFDVIENHIISLEAKQEQWGDVNKTMDHALKEIEGRFLRNLNQFGLTNIQDPIMRASQQQTLLAAQ